MSVFHEDILSAVKTALDAALTAESITLTSYSQETPDTRRTNLPCAIVSFEGAESPTGGGTNLHDFWAFPILIGLYTTDPTDDPPGCTLTAFRQAVRKGFHNKRLSGVSEVMWCEVNPQPPVIGNELPAFQQLRTALTVVAIARVLRT